MPIPSYMRADVFFKVLFAKFHHFIFWRVFSLFVSHAFILSSLVAHCFGSLWINMILLHTPNHGTHIIQAHANNIIKIFLKRYCSNNYFLWFYCRSLSTSFVGYANVSISYSYVIFSMNFQLICTKFKQTNAYYGNTRVKEKRMKS